MLVELADYLGVETNNVAEYEGLTAGLRAVRELDPDAQVDRAAGLQARRRADVGQAGRSATTRLRRLALAAKAILPADQVHARWVPRAQNKRADALVNRCLDARGGGTARPDRDLARPRRLDRRTGRTTRPRTRQPARTPTTPAALRLPEGPAVRAGRDTDRPAR